MATSAWTACVPSRARLGLALSLAVAAGAAFAGSRLMAATARRASLDFTLESADGPVSTRALRGKTLLLYFGYTFCPDVCPTFLARASEALRLLSSAERARVHVLFVSVDPERDTAQKLKAYAEYFGSGITGLTGSPSAIARVAALYGVRYAKHPLDGGDYSVDHSATAYVLDHSGELFDRLPYGSTAGQIATAMRAALARAADRDHKESPHVFDPAVSNLPECCRRNAVVRPR